MSNALVLPAQGWFLHHERPDGTVWREPVIGFAIYVGEVGHPLVADVGGGVRMANADVSEGVRLVPPDGLLRAVADYSDPEPAVDLEMDIITMIQNSGNRGMTIEELAVRTFASEKDVKERVEHLRAKGLLEWSMERHYALGARPVHELVQVLRHRFTNRGR